jgi:hypothetical protein
LLQHEFLGVWLLSFSFVFIQQDEPDLRQLQDLDAKWAIDTLNLEVIGETMQLTAYHGPGTGEAPEIQVHADPVAVAQRDARFACPFHDPAHFVPEDFKIASGVGPFPDGGLGIVTTEMYTQNVDQGSGDQLVTTWKFKFDSNIVNTQVYAAGANGQPPKVYFCVLFIVPYHDVNGNYKHGNERNFAIDATLALDGSFSLGEANGVEVQRVAAGNGVGQVAYSVTAELCEGATVIYQGQSVPFCVCADEYPVTSVSSFKSLTYTQGVHTINAVTEGAVDPILSQNRGCGFYNQKQCCQVDTVLNSNFVAVNPTNPDLVAVSGSVNLNVGGRRLTVNIQDVSGRNLETTTEEREFKQEFVMVASGAVTRGLLITASGAAMTALALFM